MQFIFNERELNRTYIIFIVNGKNQFDLYSDVDKK